MQALSRTSLPAARSVGLQPDTSLTLYIDAGTQLICTAGSLHLATPPCWIADRMLSRSCQLVEGAHCMLPERGWVMLRAGSMGAQLCLLAPAPHLSAAALVLRAARSLSRSIRRGVVRIQTQ
jgi:hypothetical protein